MDHDTRLAIAQRVTEFVLRRHPDVVAVAIHGSTAHGEDREWSDLEMFAVTRGSTNVRGYGTVHEGVVVEIALVSEEDAIREVSGVPGGWPNSVDGWLHTIPTHDPEGLLPRLSTLAAKPDPDTFPMRARGALVSMYEDLCKIRNHAAAGEDAMVRFFAPNFAAWGVAGFLGHLNRQHYNGTRDLLTKPREFARLPPHFWEDYPALLGAEGTAADLLRRAERIHGECRELFRTTALPLPDQQSLEAGLDSGRSVRD